jgi:hypothetical protein
MRLIHRWEYDIKVDLMESWRERLSLFHPYSRWAPMTGFCQRGNEHSGCIRDVLKLQEPQTFQETRNIMEIGYLSDTARKQKLHNV